MNISYDLTIAIPTFNGEKTLEKAILSVINQKLDGLKLQILISDDFSSDKTISIIEKYQNYKNVKILKNTKNPHPEYGAIRNFNTCIKNADGKYFMILCQDDYLSSNYAISTFKNLEKNENSISVGSCIGKDKKNKIIHSSYSKSINIDGIDAIRSLILGNIKTIRHAWIMMATKTNDLIKVGGFPKTLRAQCSDQILLYRLLLEKKLICDAGSTYFYLIHENSYGNSDTKYLGRAFIQSEVYWQKEIMPILKHKISQSEIAYLTKKMNIGHARLFILRVILYGGTIFQKIKLLINFEKKSWIIGILFDMYSYKRVIRRLIGFNK